MNANNLRLKPPQANHLLLPPTNPVRTAQFRRHYKRRRIKPAARRSLRPCSHLLDPFQNLLSQFPSPRSLDFLAPALGLASGLTLYLSRLEKKPSKSADIGEWILFTSLTPFNRFVLLRCPSISFQGRELLDDVNEKLVEEERHFVRLNCGRIHVSGKESGDVGGLVEKLEYQRVCVSTDDGGVLSIDWPANLDLMEERGLDTTLLLVPGTAQGSMDGNVRSFVCEALVRGFFPVVMNPRGCAGSPLTTARLFTAADSDDVCTAIQFISKQRPWTTLMGVGWGYGANMLTKYLADVGDRTPLTAVTCINNPFDLEEATRCSPHHIALDQTLRGGLVDILQSNKELFQGRAKGFDVEKALSAKSVRDFEKAISMVSHGFEKIEDFYSKSSTRGLVGNVKIPVLFIQNEDGTVPLISIPRSLIAENPFTSLLFCSGVPSSAITSGRGAESWYQNLTIEWLTAVELGLLKGRHPLLNDVDITINPSKGLALVEGRAPDKVMRDRLLDLTLTYADGNGYGIDPIKETNRDNKTAVDIYSRSRQDTNKNMELKEELQGLENVKSQQTSAVDAELIKGEAADPMDERGQGLQTAQVILNMLDATMPGNLTEEEKKKVLTAVGQGETFMKALQDAVPEDVRGKLTTAVSRILHTQHSNLKLEGLLGVGKIPNVSSGLKSMIQEKVGVPSFEGMPKDPHSTGHTKRADELADGLDNKLGSDRSVTTEPELRPSENLQKDVELGQSQGIDCQQGDPSVPVRRSTNESGNNNGSSNLLKEKPVPYFDSSEKGSETKPNVASHSEKTGGTEEPIVHEHKVEHIGGVPNPETSKENNMMTNEEKPSDLPTDQNKTASTSMTEEKPNVASRSEKADGTEEPIVHEHKVEQVGGVPNPETRTENSMITNEEKPLDLPTDQNKTVSTSVTEEKLSGLRSSADSQPVEREGNDNQRKENGTIHPILDQNKPAASNSKGPTFDVTQALDALTGMDDSTQVAVNSVFGVLENMISQFEEEKDGENDIKDRNVQEKATDFQSKGEDFNSYLPAMTQQNSGNDSEMESDRLQDPPFHEHNKNSINEQNAASTGWIEDEPTANCSLFSGDCVDGYLPDTANNYTTEEEKEMDQQIGSDLLADYADRHVNKVPLGINALPYGDYLHNEYFGQYLLSKMPKTKPLDLDTTAALLLDYFPEDGQWKLLEQSGSIGESIADIPISNLANIEAQAHLYTKVDETDDCVEPPYVVLDTKKQQEPVGNYDAMKIVDENIEDADRSEELMQLVKSVIVDDLRVEVGCKLSAANMKEVKVNLDRDLEKVGNAVSMAIACDNERTWCLQGKEYIMNCALDGEHIVRAISSAVLGTSYLRKVLPVGVIIGSSLAALRKCFNVAPGHGSIERSEVKDQEEVSIKEIDEKHTSITSKIISSNGQGMRKGKGTVSNSANNGSVMVGAVTAALGASALLVQQQDPYKGKETVESSSKTFKEGMHSQKAADMLDETTSEKNQNNLVTSLAEKAMLVASPVVPTKEDGEVDQERLVAILADLGQKGGMLKLVGKLALLWGGIRGATSLTDRLITFLRIAERPLYQRILGFVGMVLVLWSPVIVPLLPTLVQSWTTRNPSRFAELVCIIGLYAAVLILVALWGKRIRGHKNPLAQYGLDLTSPPKVQDFLKGLLGGFFLVLSIQSVKALLGCGSFSWPSSPPSSSLGAIKYLRVSGHIIMLAGQGLITAASVALVEELLFRSWLLEEIATDLGYHQGIIISGLAFSLFQRSPLAVPGLWLLSLALAAFRQRSKGSLSIPIGLRTGLMAASFVLQTGGFLTYNPNAPLWLTGTHPFQPFSGVVGLAFSLILAISLYPRQSIRKKRKWNRVIRE